MHGELRKPNQAYAVFPRERDDFLEGARARALQGGEKKGGGQRGGMGPLKGIEDATAGGFICNGKINFLY